MAALERRGRADVADDRLEVGHRVLVGVGDPVGPHDRVVRDPDDAAGHARSSRRPAPASRARARSRRRRRRRARRPCRRRPIRRSRSRRWSPTSSCHVPLASRLEHVSGHVDRYYDIKVNRRHHARGGRRSHDRLAQARSPIPREGFGAPKDRTGQRHRLGRPAGGHRGVLRRRPHLAAEDIFYERFPGVDEGPGAPRRLRRRRLDARHRREDLPAAGVHRRADAVRPAGRRRHQRRRGPARASSSPTASTGSWPSPTRCSG